MSPVRNEGPLKVAVAHKNLHLDIPTTYRKASIIPEVPFVSPTVFKQGNEDKLEDIGVNEYDYEM